MTETTQTTLPPFPWRIAGWGCAGALLLLPAAAMQFTHEVVWSGSDFAVTGAMLLLAGLALEGLVRASRSTPYRLGAGIAVAAGLLLVWVNLAVGFLGDEGNPANLMFLFVLAVAIAGSIFSRSRARAMAATMASTATVQVLLGAIGYFAGFASPGGGGTYEVVLGTALFAGLWLAAAALFHTAARDENGATLTS